MLLITEIEEDNLSLMNQIQEDENNYEDIKKQSGISRIKDEINKVQTNIGELEVALSNMRANGRMLMQDMNVTIEPEKKEADTNKIMKNDLPPPIEKSQLEKLFIRCTGTLPDPSQKEMLYLNLIYQVEMAINKQIGVNSKLKEQYGSTTYDN